MAHEKFEPHTQTKTDKEAPVKPDPETLETTDPQEHMKGPLSSLMQKIEGGMESEKPKEETKEEK